MRTKKPHTEPGVSLDDIPTAGFEQNYQMGKFSKKFPLFSKNQSLQEEPMVLGRKHEDAGHSW